MESTTRSLSRQESRVVLALREGGRQGVAREEIISLLGATPKAVDNIIESLRRKGWLERASWGKYLLVPPEHGAEAIGNSNLLAQASLIAKRYYIGYGTAAAHYGFTTQHRNTIFLVTPEHLRPRRVGEAQIRIVNPSPSKFFGYEPVDVLGYKVMMSDREKTAIDCVDRPELAGGVGEVALIVATASRRLDWNKAVDYLTRIKSGALVRRFGWLIDHARTEAPGDIRERLMSLTGRSTRAWLGSSPRHDVPSAIGYDRVWRLFVNVTPEELNGSAGMGQRRSIKRDS
jgi:predicted transcriptional regulator of viral defense system